MIVADDEENRSLFGDHFAAIRTAVNPFEFFDYEGDGDAVPEDEDDTDRSTDQPSAADPGDSQAPGVPEGAPTVRAEVDVADEGDPEPWVDGEGNVVWPPTGDVEVEMDLPACIDDVDEPTAYDVHLLDPILQPGERGAFAALVVATSVSGTRLFTMATHEWEEDGQTCRRLAVYRLVEDQWWRVFAVRADERHSAHILLGGFVEALDDENPLAVLRERVRVDDRDRRRATGAHRRHRGFCRRRKGLAVGLGQPPGRRRVICTSTGRRDLAAVNLTRCGR